MILSNINHALTISLIIIFVKLLYILILKTKPGLKPFIIGELKLIFIEFGFIFIFIFILFTIFNALFSSQSVILTFAISLLITTGIITYQFVLEPAINYLKNNEIKLTLKYSDLELIKKNKINIYYFESEKMNAFATGILPGTKTILLSSKLVAMMTHKEILAIIYHEIGHIKKNHLLRLYIISIISMIPGLINSSLIMILLNDSELKKFLIIFNGSLFFGLIPLLILSYYQKKYEFEADLFSSEQTKNEDIIDALNKININSAFNLEKKSLSHPVISKRISNVKKNNFK